MANTKSALKAIRVSEKRRLHNRAARSRMRTTIRKAEMAVAATGPTPDAASSVQDAISIIDRTASKGVIHRNQADRRKSRLMKKLNRLQAQA
ncbi:MAG: 30S ribosomal protein S20 [Chloroflexi bacterium]|nr:30S ribosomal protein S20 [Chloroflexota bacterium]MCL5109091.1 30S ribosomal protein S20 [Chloroflexota bacterium]